MSGKYQKLFLYYTAALIAAGALQVFACDACNDADTVRSGIIEAMRARSAERRNSNANAGVPATASQSRGFAFDSNFFDSPAPEPAAPARRGRPIVGED